MTPVSKSTQLKARVAAKLSTLTFSKLGLGLVFLTLVAIAVSIWWNEHANKIEWKDKYTQVQAKYEVLLGINQDIDSLSRSRHDSITTFQRNELRAELGVARAKEAIKIAVREKDQALASLSAERRKLKALTVAFVNGDISAERYKDSLSTSPIFKTQVEAEDAYLRASTDRDIYRTKLDEAVEVNTTQASKVSDLEALLNKDHEAFDATQQVLTDLRKQGQDKLDKQSFFTKLVGSPLRRYLKENGDTLRKASDRVLQIKYERYSKRQ